VASHWKVEPISLKDQRMSNQRFFDVVDANDKVWILNLDHIACVHQSDGGYTVYLTDRLIPLKHDEGKKLITYITRSGPQDSGSVCGAVIK
jgi:hypothetical protein